MSTVVSIAVVAVSITVVSVVDSAVMTASWVGLAAVASAAAIELTSTSI